MDRPFAFIDRAVELSFYEDDPVTVTLYLGDTLEEQIARAVRHYDLPHTAEEDRENLAALLGKEQTEAILSRAENPDRLTVLEILSYVIRSCREDQAKKLEALAAG